MLETTGDDSEKRHKSGDKGVAIEGDNVDEYHQGFPPKGVSKHGPAFSQPLQR